MCLEFWWNDALLSSDWICCAIVTSDIFQPMSGTKNVTQNNPDLLERYEYHSTQKEPAESSLRFSVSAAFPPLLPEKIQELLKESNKNQPCHAVPLCHASSLLSSSVWLRSSLYISHLTWDSMERICLTWSQVKSLRYFGWWCGVDAHGPVEGYVKDLVNMMWTCDTCDGSFRHRLRTKKWLICGRIIKTSSCNTICGKWISKDSSVPLSFLCPNDAAFQQSLSTMA